MQSSQAGLVKVRGVLLVPDVGDRVVMLHGRSSSVVGMVVPLVDKGPGEESEETESPGEDVACSSLKVSSMGNVRNRVLNERVHMGLDRSLGHLGSLKLERKLGNLRSGVAESSRSSQKGRRSHGHHSRGLESSDGSRLHCC